MRRLLLSAAAIALLAAYPGAGFAQPASTGQGDTPAQSQPRSTSNSSEPGSTGSDTSQQPQTGARGTEGPTSLTTGAPTQTPACTVIDPEFENQLRAQPEMRSNYSGDVMRDLRQLRDAARILERHGMTDACVTVASAIREIAADRQSSSRSGSSPGGEQSAPGEQRSGSTQSMPDTGTRAASPAADTGTGQFRENREAALSTYESALPITEVKRQLRAANILGTDVRGMTDETIGEVSDIVFDSAGKASYAVISYGGFLGLAEEASAVPFNMLRISQGRDVFYLPLSEDQLERAPRFEQGTFDWNADQEWRQQNDQYFDTIARSGG